jgi:hypothetical protein
MAGLAQAQVNTPVQWLQSISPPSFPWQAGSLAVASFDNATMDAALPGVYVAGIAFLFPSQQRWVSTGAGPVALVAADLDGDGDVDVAVAEQDSGTVSVLTNDGLGGFARTASYATGDPTTSPYPAAISAADINGDNKLDLVVVNRGAETVVVLRNTGGGFVRSQTVTVGGEPCALALGDFDANGWTDVAVACAAEDSVKVLANEQGLLAAAGAFEGGPFPVALAVADLNDDGSLDLAAADHEAPQVTLLLNDGTGRFASQALMLSDPNAPFEPPLDVQLVDLNSDGRIDMHCAGMALLNKGGANFVVAARNAIAVVYGQGSRPGEPMPWVGMAYTTPVGYYSNSNTVKVGLPALGPVPGDTNGDGHVDVVDLLGLVYSFGTSDGDPAFDPACDFNDDDSVDVVDLLIMVDFWGV